MRYFILTAALTALFGPAVSADDTDVEGYYRDDGTYVQGHYRTEPNEYKFDNYSAEGNYNPYTGEEGTRDHEFSTPDYGDGFDSDFDSGYDSDLYD